MIDYKGVTSVLSGLDYKSRRISINKQVFRNITTSLLENY